MTRPCLPRLGDVPDEFTAEDDRIHSPNEDFYFTETFWYSFFVPERDLGGWLYTGLRPNAGVTFGGCWIWDATGVAPWEIPFFEQFHWLKITADAGNADIEFPTGMSVATVTPGMAYDVSYNDRRRCEARLHYHGLERPVPLRSGTPPYPKASHFDQTCRVNGWLKLDDERIGIDGHAMRDRSWGARRERGFQPMAYTWLANEAMSILVYSRPLPDGTDEIYAGYVRRRDQISYIRSGTRRLNRNSLNHWVTSMEINVVAEDGTHLAIRGDARSRMVLPGATNVCVNTVLTFSVEGQAIHGEDQDVWPNDAWRTRRPSRFPEALGSRPDAGPGDGVAT